MTDSKSRLADELAAEGYAPGTPAYEYAALQRRVTECQSRKGVVECGSCDYFDFCETAKQFLVLKRAKAAAPKETAVTVPNEGRLPDWMFHTRRTDEPDK